MNCDWWRSHSESLLVRRNFVSSIYKLKPKKNHFKPKNLTFFVKKNLGFC